MPYTLLKALSGLVMGASAWFSVGVFALTPHGGDTTSVGLLPPLWVLACLMAAGVIVALRFTTLSPTLMLLPALVLLPWIGLRAAPALLWAGPVVALLWVLVAIGVVRAVWSRSPRAAGGLLIGTMLLVVAATSSRAVVSGDEPHYLLIARSLQLDGDIDLANDHDLTRHADIYAGALEPHHTILTLSGREYSFHGLGVVLLAFPGFALAGVAGARAMLLLISVLGVIGLWAAVRRVANADTSAPWVAVSFLVLQLPFTAQAAAIYPDGPGAAIVAAALLTLIRIERGERVGAIELYACGAGLALLPWLHIRLTWIAMVFAAGLAAALWRRPQRAPALTALFAIPVVGAALFFAASYVMFGTLDPTNPFRQKASGSITNAPFGVFGLLVDGEYGLLPFAPAAVFAVPGIRRLAQQRRITAICASASIVGTLLISGAFVWWGGTSSPARFLVPVLPVAALCIAAWWVHAHQVARAACLALIAIGGVLAAAAGHADGGSYLITAPDGALTIFEWLNNLVRIPDALPSLFRPEAEFRTELAIAALWAIGSGFMLVAAQALWPRFASAHDPWTAAAWATAIVITATIPLAWMMRTGNAVTADRSQLALLRASESWWLTTGWHDRRPASSVDSALRAIAFESPVDRERRVLHVPFPPAGRYRIEVDTGNQLPAGTAFTLEAGQRGLPLLTWPASSESPPFEMVMPVYSIRVVADGPIESDVHVRLRMLGRERVAAIEQSGVAQQVARYGEFVVYLLDGTAALEASGFWLNGERRTALVLAALDGPVPPATLQLEAADLPVDAILTLGTWRHNMSVEPRRRASVALPATSNTPARLNIELRGGQRGRPSVFVRILSAAEATPGGS